ncbi:MAG: hypothetical protein IJZ81_00355, partial [Clostridia bacterium]|nr:hypothetical protein [Clostridia bacterium]
MLKRIFALIMSLLLSVSLLQQFVFANEFISVEFYDATTNKKIDKIDGQQNIYAKVKFTAPDDGDAAIVVGKYNADGTLESAVPQTAQSLTPGEMS